ncbi:acyl-CoA-binding protein, acbp [Reticulomyxa filosa]|uniref:Acyl-CoA-binding protein, acbp n=1 Tax=Reticulomyxa filosa TaxID=46433 RepID=X6MEM9_RETFI|nr:acyl-CoA-binding protein, acbp [Reticulomyxa filosa]|eukprot:ETO12131.1 acyl-CoA-binding protein, acbp [Reticulomyxa filosa]
MGLKQAQAEKTSFEKAVEYVRSLPADGPVKLDDTTKLKFYGMRIDNQFCFQYLFQKKKDVKTQIKNPKKQDITNKPQLAHAKIKVVLNLGLFKLRNPALKKLYFGIQCIPLFFFNKQVEARAKWDAWNSLGSMSETDAKKNYVELLEKISNGEFKP